jgi:peptidoglycan/LPS O-acetylase OafA/YrhL
MSDARSNVDAFQRIPTLDGWRAVAILLVLFDHGADALLRAGLALTAHAGAFDSQSYAWLKDPIGRGGVHLFFALSGYLITRRLLQEELRFGAISVGGFYLRRLVRIQPAAIVFLLVVGVLGSSGVLAVSGPGWRAALLGYANFAMASQTWTTVHFWSLAVEEHFYLLWPLVFALLGPRRRLAGSLAIALLLGVWLGIVVRYHLVYSPYVWVRSDIEGSWVMWGCVAALAEATPAGTRFIGLLARPGVCLVALPLAVFSVVFSGLDWKIVCGATVLTAAATPLLLIGTLRRPGGGLGAVLELRPLAWLGRISYSVYLWQEIFFVWDDERSAAFGALQSPPWRLLLTLACAATSYYALEKPAIRLGARVLGRRTPPPPPPPEGLRNVPANHMHLVRRRTLATRTPNRRHSRR